MKRVYVFRTSFKKQCLPHNIQRVIGFIR